MIFVLPWIMLRLPWVWVEIGCMPWGELRIELYDPNRCSKYLGPKLWLELRLCPDRIHINGDGWGWISPREPSHWKYEFESWGRKSA